MQTLRRNLFIAGAILLFSAANAQNLPYKSTYEITPADTHEDIVRKAAHVVPTSNQLAALQDEFIAFVHFGPNTFSRREWGTGMEDPAIFVPKTLDTDQWCEAIRAAGMKKVLLTVKHHDGFVLWQSRYTKHGIMSSPFQNGQGDVLRSLSESCRKYGLKLGIYLSPCDLHEIEAPDGIYGNLSSYTERTIPRNVEGRPFKNKTKFTFKVDDYNEYFLNQLFEILTEYGPIDELWFDGAHPKQKGGQRYYYPAWRKLIRKLAPKAVIFGREDVRWCGNEAGATRDTEWNVIAYGVNPDTSSVFRDMTAADLGSREALYKARYIHYQQPETDTSIREGWFYRDDDKQRVRTADDVFDIYERSVGGNCTFLLNIPPNREGRFSATDVEVLREVGQRIKSTYGINLFAKAAGPKKLLDGNINTFVEVPEGKSVELSLPSSVQINRVMLQEAIAKRGERVERFAVDAWVDGAWQEVATATNIGYKRIVRFPDVTTSRLRLRILESRLTPGIAALSAHYYAARPPQLTAARSLDGMVALQPAADKFGWNRNSKNKKIQNTNAVIYYTTDGTQPTERSKRYTGPFMMERGEVRAFAVSNGFAGSELRQEFGLRKNAWHVQTSWPDAKVDHPLSMSTDEQTGTYWLAEKKADAPLLTIDLGGSLSLRGFAYTPPTQRGIGLLAKGRIQVSVDGKKWTDVQTFEFGNLVNDPTRRYCYFPESVQGRYVRIYAEDITGNSFSVGVAEIEIL